MKMTAVMRLEFDDGEVLYYKPHAFQLLTDQFDRVENWERLVVPVDSYEARQAGCSLFDNLKWVKRPTAYQRSITKKYGYVIVELEE